MPVPIVQQLTGGGRSFRDALLEGPRRSRRSTIPELQEQIRELELLQQQTGAKQPEEDRPGLFGRIIDVLSGFNFAVAGATEELARGNGMDKAIGRFGRELISSAQSVPVFGDLLRSAVGEVEAEKEGFGEVFEELGIGTIRLSDAIPMLDGTILGRVINTRGAAGLAADIFTDPLTYVTFGLGKGIATTAKFSKQFGARFLTKGGRKRLLELDTALRRERGLVDDSGRLVGAGTDDDVFGEAADRLLTEIEGGATNLLNRGGIRFAGITIPGTPGLGSAFSAQLVRAANRVPGGNLALESGRRVKGRIDTAINHVFSGFGPLEKAPPIMRKILIRLGRNSNEKMIALNLRRRNELSQLRLWDYLRKNPARARPIVEVFDGSLGRSALKEGEAELMQPLRNIINELGEGGAALGFLDPKQIESFRGIDASALRGYLMHRYDNPVEDFNQVWTGWKAQHGEAIITNHSRGQQFLTMRQAEEISQQLHDVSVRLRNAGQNVPIYPVLKPSKDLEGMVLSYLDWWTSEAQRKMLVQEFRQVAGIDVARRLDDTLIGDELAPTGDIALSPKSMKVLKAIKNNDKQIGKVTPALKALPDSQRKEVIRAYLHEFTKDGNALMARSAALADAGFIDDLPKTLGGSLEGLVDPGMEFAMWGEKARYRVVGGNKIWGDDLVFMPEAVVDYVESGAFRFTNTSEWREMRKALRVIDRTNHAMRSWVYPFWPSSAFRDIASNVMFASFGMGWHALDVTKWIDSVRMVKAVNMLQRRRKIFRRTGRIAPGTTDEAAKRQVREVMQGEQITRVDGTKLDATEVAEAAIDRGVPQTFSKAVEATPDGRYRFTGKVGRQVQGILDARQDVENIQRLSMFTYFVQQGLNFDDAANEVAKYLFNYSEISKFNRVFLRRVMLFPTFQIKNIQFHAEQALKRPGLLINELKAFRGRSDEDQQMAEFKRDALKLRLNRDGKTLVAMTGIDVPTRTLDNVFAGTPVKTIRRLIGMMSPLVKTPIEASTGFSFFTGQPMVRTRSDAMGQIFNRLPRGLQDWFGYKKEVRDSGQVSHTFDAVRFNTFFRSFIFSRIISTSDRQFREYIGTDATFSRSALDVLTGMRIEEINLTDEQRRLLFRRIEQMERSLEARGEGRRKSIFFRPSARQSGT